ncbi:MAG TPA: VCBS repeat-containing protein, partial [Bacteroidales bacterium]
TDAQTTQNGLSYNIRVGTTPGGSDIVNPMASTTSGDRKINALGNACQKNDGFILKNLPTGTYFWSVQAIDNSFAGGSWATENTFTISAGQASNLVTDSIGLAGIKLSWTNGSGDKRIVLMAEGSKSTVALPLNGISYIANSSFGSGTQIGSSDWYCIYNDTGSNITVTNLKEYAIYSIAVFEYNGDPGKENYNASTFKENVAFAKTKSIFEEQTDIFLIGLKNSSAAWGDYNNDGFLDILMTGDSSTRSIKKPVTIIYKNNGNEIFTEQTGISVPGVINGSVAWGDYNNDGLLDIAITGDTGTVSSSPMSKIYKSNGDGTFSEQAGIHLTGLSNSSLAWNDFNNDGLLDLVLCGNTGNYYIAKIYKNNGDGTFSEQTIIDLNEVDLMYSTGGKNNIAVNDYNNDGFKDILLAEYNTNSNYPYIAKIYKNNGDGTFVKQNEITGLSGSSVAWGDYNNDGWLDILLTAHIGAPVYYGSKIYKNNGDGTFSEQTGVSLPGAYQGSVAWGDYNNDGYLDILALSGPSNLFPTTRIYKNNGDGTFSVQNGISLPNLNQASIAWGDYNSDSYLDILLTGSGVTKIYKNIGTYSTNSIANAPGNLHQKINFNNIKLKWDKASDAQTPQNGLNYNIRVGTTPGNCNILNPMASVANGYRRIPAIGNAGQKNDTLTLNLPAGTYYWSVQAIDNAYAGGAWATENTFTITSQQTSNIALDSLSLSAMKLSWTNGNGDKRVVFATHGNNTVTIPTNNTTYSPNDTFGIGSQIGTSGWYCVYNSDTGNKVTVKGIEGIMEFPFLQFYKVAVFDYSGTPGNEIYNTSISNGNLISVETKQLFEEQKGISFTRYCDASAWGDYNNDGWLDVIVTGYFGPFCPAAIYKNNGDGTFTEQTGISLKGVGRDCSVAWGDYNNDNYLDLVLSGYRGHGNGSGTALYKNNGDGTFSEQTS